MSLALLRRGGRVNARRDWSAGSAPRWTAAPQAALKLSSFATPAYLVHTAMVSLTAKILAAVLTPTDESVRVPYLRSRPPALSIRSGIPNP
ncbi:MAG: hypothetical protein K0Q61_2781 [Rhodococcus erythropolis]|nr:hypothetical protein [Rhodococcus erythropolis]